MTSLNLGMEGFLSMLASLFFVLLLLLVVLAMMKKLGSVNVTSPKKKLQIRDSQSLGARQKLVLITVRGKDILLGVSPQEIRMISEWESVADEPELDDEKSKKSFKEGLLALLSNRP
jgi:flagellar biosynthetic protein FliO